LAADDEEVWSLLSHVSVFLLPIIGPLMVMQTAAKRSSYVRHHAAEALNSQITMVLLAGILTTMVSVIGPLQFEQEWLVVIIIAALVVAVIVAWFVFPSALRFGPTTSSFTGIR